MRWWETVKSCRIAARVTRLVNGALFSVTRKRLMKMVPQRCASAGAAAAGSTPEGKVEPPARRTGTTRAFPSTDALPIRRDSFPVGHIAGGDVELRLKMVLRFRSRFRPAAASFSRVTPGLSTRLQILERDQHFSGIPVLVLVLSAAVLVIDPARFFRELRGGRA